MKKTPLAQKDLALVARALEALRQDFGAAAHYHTVGAALRCKNGRVYTGVNCDGIHGSCAEFTAMGAALTAGEREFDTVVAVHEKAPNHLVPPCGNCRQMLFEYCPEIRVILNDEKGRPVKVGLRDLLPLAYEEIPGE